MALPEHHSDAHVGTRRAYQWFAVFLAAAFGAFAIRFFSLYGTVGLVLVFVPVFVGIWMLAAQELWWILLPAAYSFGGMFWFGFRLYTHEVALLLVLLALLPWLLATNARIRTRRPIPTSVFLLAAYFAIHGIVSIYISILAGEGGVGNIGRVYLRGFWPLIFLFTFYWFGSTRLLRLVLAVIYVSASLRVCLGLVGYFWPRVLYIPVISFVFPAAYSGGVDLRESALVLVPVAFCYARLAQSRIKSLFHVLMIILGGGLVLLGGSRVSLGVFCAIALCWAAFHKRFVLLSTIALSLLGSVLFLSSDSTVLNPMPRLVRRTLSILVIPGPNSEVHKMVASSDYWHRHLMRRAAERWLESPRSFLVGHRVQSFDEAAFLGMSADMRVKAEVAAGMGSYEAGLWTVLAVLGLCGAILYVLLFWWLLRDVVFVLLRDGVCDYRHAFYFLAVSGALIWVVFCWIVGHFPSWQLMLAVIAKAAYEDSRHEAQTNEAEETIT